MAERILFLFLTSVFIATIVLAVKTGDASHSPIIRRLMRKTSTLQQEVEELWAIVSSGSQGNGNIDKAYFEKVEATVKNLKSDINHIVVTTRSGLHTEKQWIRELSTNLTEKFDDLHNRVRPIIDDLGDGQNKLELEIQALQRKTNVLQNENEKSKTENRALGQTLIDIQNDNSQMRQTLLAIQNDNTKMNAELIKQQAKTTTATVATPPFLCGCDEGWKCFNGHCYLMVKEEKNWDDAEADCAKRDSYLLAINTDNEHDFVENELLLDYHGRRASFWIGAKFMQNQGLHIYKQGGCLLKEKYWYEGEPNNMGGAEHCVVMILISDVLALHDVHCSNIRYFVCEKS